MNGGVKKFVQDHKIEGMVMDKNTQNNSSSRSTNNEDVADSVFDSFLDFLKSPTPPKKEEKDKETDVKSIVPTITIGNNITSSSMCEKKINANNNTVPTQNERCTGPNGAGSKSIDSRCPIAQHNNNKTKTSPRLTSTLADEVPLSMDIKTTASVTSSNINPAIDHEHQKITQTKERIYCSLSQAIYDIEAQTNLVNQTSVSLVQEQPSHNGCRSQVRLWFKQNIQPFWKIIIAQIICIVYILVLTFSPPPVGIRDPITNNIIDTSSAENTEHGVIYVNGSYRPVVAVGCWQKFCLAMSRMSAFSMYPMMVVVFLTKMKATQTFLSKTPFSMYFGMIKEGHDFHAYAGKYIAFDVWWHTLFHCLRWASQGNIRLLWTSAAGLSGLITLIATPLITFPMMYCKEKISYEIRKGLHYLFYLFAIAMCFHVPPSAIPNGGFIAPILGSCIVMYTLDTIYVYFFMCEKIETTSFHVLSSGVRISMPVSERFQEKAERGGYAYINLPWIDNKQWHPFSLFEDPSDPSIQQMFLLKCGDWTNAVHATLARDTTRGCFIKGPFPSPYSHASLYDNQILVASGIGITPALAAINAFKSSRRINLIWAVRDPEMLEFFLEHMYLDHDGWNLIFYTGKKPLTSAIEMMNTNVRVVKGRPDFGSVIPNIIYGIESKQGLPEKYTEGAKLEIKNLLSECMVELESTRMSATSKVAKLVEYGDTLGFSLDKIYSDKAYRDSNSDPVSECNAVPTEVKDGLDNFLEELKSSMTSSMSYIRTLSSESFGESVTPSHETKKDLVDRPLARRGSLKRWKTMRQVVDETDSNELLKPAFLPWKENEMQTRFVKRLDRHIMSTWGIMYCGGSKAVISTLQEISFDYNIDLHIDSFAW